MKKTVCCCIDNSEISISVGYYRKSVWTIEYCEIIPFTREFNPQLKDKIELACDKILALKQKKIIIQKNISFTINDSAIIEKNILVPTLHNKKEQIETLNWAIRNENILLEENHLRYKIIRQKVDKSIKQTEYLINTANRKFLLDICVYIKEKTGLKPKIIVSKDYCLYTLYSNLAQIKEGEIYSIINFQQNNTLILMLTKNGVLFSRDIPIGAYNITELLMQKFNISESESEDMQKIAADAYKNKIKGSEAYAALDEFLSRFTDNINRTFDFFSSMEHNRRLDGIILTGCPSAISLIEDKLTSSFLNVKLEKLLLKLNINIDEKNYSTEKPKEFQQGLVNRALINFAGLYFEKNREMDIIPPYFNRFSLNSSLMIGIYYFIFLLLISLFGARHISENYSLQKNKLSTDIEIIKTQISKEKEIMQNESKMINSGKNNIALIDMEIRSLEESKNSIIARYQDVSQFVGNKRIYSNIYELVTAYSIGGVFIEEINFFGNHINISGVAFDQTSIISYLQKFEQTRGINGLKINSIEDMFFKTKKLKKFVIEFNYDE